MSNKIIFNKFKFLCDNNFSRLGQTFETENNKYFYDSGTGKVFACDDVEYYVLKELISTSNLEKVYLLNYQKKEINKALINIYKLYKSEHILQLPYYNKFMNNTNKSKEIKQLILEVTQQCNLRCKYCVYGDDCSYFHEFNNSNMSWDTARKIIDYTINHSGNDLFIGFYGGEPLLKFELIKQCIEYCEKLNTTKNFHYSITSNLTLVTKEIADFFSSLKNINILCSIDGPKIYHDQYRNYLNKKGSFEDTIAGLKYLISSFKERAKDVISINSVITPPYDQDKLSTIKNFFESEELFPPGIKFRYSYVSYGSLKNSGIDTNFDTEISTEEFYSQNFNSTDPIKYWAVNQLCKCDNIRYEKSIEAFSLIKMQNRPISDLPIKFLSRNGCCDPGYGRLYVTSDGKFKVCEKIGDSPNFGDIKNGLCEQCIQSKFINEYDYYSLKECNECWAVHLCDVCYSTCYDKNGINVERKHKTCQYARSNAKNSLIEYYQILETKPDLLDEMNYSLINEFDE